jgi:DNA anti-recombination protein RmuC
MNQIIDAIFRMMVVPNCSNCEVKDRQNAEMIVDFNREKKEMKDEFNRNFDDFNREKKEMKDEFNRSFDDFKKSLRKEFTEEIAMLKEVCLHPKLENVSFVSKCC